MLLTSNQATYNLLVVATYLLLKPMDPCRHCAQDRPTNIHEDPLCVTKHLAWQPPDLTVVADPAQRPITVSVNCGC